MNKTAKTILFSLVFLMPFSGLYLKPRSDMQAYEGASAILAATGSYLERSLDKDNSKQSYLLRLLISMTRIIHGGLVLTNHSTDYNPYHTTWLATDIGHLIWQVRKLIETDNDLINEKTINQSQNQTVEFEETFKNLSTIVLSALEALSGLVITDSTEQTQQAKTTRFIAQTILSLSRLSQTIFHTEESLKKVLVAALIAHCGHLLYQTLYEDSQFNVWVTSHAYSNINRQELTEALNTRFGGITCVRGHYDRPLSEAEIEELARNLEINLNEQGLQFIRAEGRYNGGRIPNSYIILDITEQELVTLAHRFAQDSVISFNNGSARMLTLRNQSGNRVYNADRWEEITSSTPQNCTRAQTNDGDFCFTYNFNFN